MKKLVVGLLVTAVLGGWICWTLTSPARPGERAKSAVSISPVHANGKDDGPVSRGKRAVKIPRPARGQAESAAREKEKPTFDIGQKEEERLSEAQRKLIEDIRLALREDDYRRLMALVHKMQASDEWPDGIPTPVKQAALEALGWYGSKCLPEIVGFLGDANPDVVSSAVDYWEDAIAECDSDREIAAQVILAARVVNSGDSMESILVETMNMRHSVAVDSFKQILTTGNELAKQKVLEQISDYTEDPAIQTAEQLDAWLESHPDDAGDEEVYGSISDDADDD